MAAGTHWGTAIADVRLQREEAARERARTTQALRSELERAVSTEGLTFIGRIEGELRAAAAAFNHRLGRPLLDVDVSVNGAVSVRSRDDGAFVLIVPDLRVEEGHAAGVAVTERQYGRERLNSYSFLVHNSRLHLECGGAVQGAEQFVRGQLEPWLSALPLGGR